MAASCSEKKRYKDSNGDGVGDIPGIISTLDYLKYDVGVDIVWLSPMYDSPQVDMGYDISNHEDIYPPYGTMADMDALITGCHDRGLRIILDLVINHTSDQHAWFQESRSSKDNAKRNWYIWRPAKYIDGKGRQPPNIWVAAFGGSAWEWDETTQEYYLHLFTKEQPDLNWDNPITREAIYQSAIRFWLNRKVDGFRVDTANMYSKPTDFVDAPIVDRDSSSQLAMDLWCTGPRIHEYWLELGSKVLAPYDVVTVGECLGVYEYPDALAYVGAAQNKLSMLFQFDLTYLGKDPIFQSTNIHWTLPEFKALTMKWQKFVEAVDGWSTVFLENHDMGRSISRFPSDAPNHRAAAAKMLAIYQTTLTGTLFLYQGQEVGITNVPRSWSVEEYLDVSSQSIYNTTLKRFEGEPAQMEQAMDYIQRTARDNNRTPMHWDDSNYAGFSTAKPWMRVNDSYIDINVKQQRNDRGSVLAFWQMMLQLRKEYAELFVYGNAKEYDNDNPATFTFAEECWGRRALISLNFTSIAQPIHNPLDSVQY